MATTIQGYYNGLHLPSYIKYDSHNIKKANSVLAIAFKEQHQLYEFEVPIGTKFDQFGAYKLYPKDPTAKFLWKITKNNYYNLCIYTHLDVDAALKCVNQLNPDYKLKKHIADINTKAVEAALTTYSLAEYDPTIPKKGKKSKRLAGSDLTEEEKRMMVDFILTPTIVRPS
ncbi:hypothetical protein RFY41_00665 [Acinetobacter soli]|uniref:hypothetical protein n=1 Tax=Acinetobacter soli TaxID=487316 RepID=UPI0028141E08|nr:hypothetical protein [Acinetobacter soli]MDQ9831571.1 hypothetical protein [Acinetobacter soli]